MKSALNTIASRIKGRDYELDSRLSLGALLGLAIRRLVWAVRGILHFPLRRKLLFIGPGTNLRNRSHITVANGVTVGLRASIDGLSKNGVRIGRNVNIGPYTIIQASGVLSNLGTGCSIGENSGIGAYSFIGCGGGVSIGSNVIMGQYVSFHSENHITARIDIPIRQQGVKREGIRIDDDCWVGAKATFLDGAHVGTGCVIAAGTVVRGVIPPYSIVAGVPGRIIRSRKNDDDRGNASTQSS